MQKYVSTIRGVLARRFLVEYVYVVSHACRKIASYATKGTRIVIHGYAEQTLQPKVYLAYIWESNCFIEFIIRA